MSKKEKKNRNRKNIVRTSEKRALPKKADFKIFQQQLIKLINEE
jgi:hypothetical protein